MIATPQTRRLVLAYVVLLAFSLLLLAFSGSAPLLELRRGVGFALAPIQDALRGGASQVGAVFSTIAELERLRQLTADLERRTQELEAENRRLESLRIENEQLSELLDVRSALECETVAAEVISRNASQNERVLTLDRGTDDGVSEGDPVVAGGGALVGYVREVGPNFSGVLLLNDTRFTVVGLIEASRATGEVVGQLERPLLMERIPSTDEVTEGEAVVTAGIDLGEGVRSPFPKGLLIGTVVDVLSTPNEVVQSALLLPAAPLQRLEYVLVITDYEGGLPSETPAASPVPAP
jgi:rod shape-determining protein MreC